MVVAAKDGTVIAMRRTDSSGQIAPVAIPAPEISYSLEPDPGQQPFTQVDLFARAEGFEQIEAMDIQIFPDRVTDLNLEFIPISELPSRWDQTVVYNTPVQSL